VVVPDLPAGLRRRVDALAGDPSLGDVVAMLAADLIGYQNRAYASSFLDDVEDVAGAESGVVGEPGRLTETFARSLHKLMAYKDEYEVARLMLAPEAADAAVAVVGGDATVTWHLAPPTFRAFGREGKIAVGRWATPAVGALRRMKGLRGSAFDPFGRTAMRRTERSLPGEYVRAMRQVLATLDSERIGEAVEIAALPDRVRGFEDLKTRRIGEFRRQLEDAVHDFVAP
jgi:indolepyruvate ferredoxin oxidoreductase